MNTSVDTSFLIRASLLLAGLATAVLLGVLIGESNWTVLAVIGAILALLSVAQFTVRHLIAICLVLVTLDFWMAPTGFKISPMEQIGIVGAACWLLVAWRRNFNTLAPTHFFGLRSYRFFQNTVFVAAAYAAAHFVYNMLDPYDELAFGWKGATKSYAQTFGAFLMIVFLARGRLLFPITARYSVILLWVFLLGLVVCVAIGVVRAITIGPEQATGLSMQEKSDLMKLFLIPGLNAHDNIYTLRQLGPAAVLVGSVFFFARPKNLGPFLPLAITGFGFLGSLVSAGRASLVFAAAFMVAAMVYSKRGPLAFGIGAFAAVAISALLVVPAATLKEAPWHIQRSVGWLRPDLRTQATEGIEGSSNMRIEHFKFAWEHYISGDARLILFGRSVGQMDGIDVMSFALNNELAQKEFGIRRLATHNGLTDFLLGWGVFGYLLNVLMCVSCIIMLFSYLKHFSRNSHGSCWLFSAGSFMLFWLIYTHVGGSFVWPLAIGFVLIALAQVDGLFKPKWPGVIEATNNDPHTYMVEGDQSVPSQEFEVAGFSRSEAH